MIAGGTCDFVANPPVLAARFADLDGGRHYDEMSVEREQVARFTAWAAELSVPDLERALTVTRLANQRTLGGTPDGTPPLEIVADPTRTARKYVIQTLGADACLQKVTAESLKARADRNALSALASAKRARADYESHHPPVPGERTAKRVAGIFALAIPFVGGRISRSLFRSARNDDHRASDARPSADQFAYNVTVVAEQREVVGKQDLAAQVAATRSMDFDTQLRILQNELDCRRLETAMAGPQVQLPPLVQPTLSVSDLGIGLSSRPPV